MISHTCMNKEMLLQRFFDKVYNMSKTSSKKSNLHVFVSFNYHSKESAWTIYNKFFLDLNNNVKHLSDNHRTNVKFQRSSYPLLQCPLPTLPKLQFNPSDLHVQQTHSFAPTEILHNSKSRTAQPFHPEITSK